MQQLKHRLYLMLEAGRANDRLARAFDIGICTRIVLNVAEVALGTVPEVADSHRLLLSRFEVFSVVVFTVEYIARMWVCVLHPPLSHLRPLRARLRFARQRRVLLRDDGRHAWAWQM